MNIFGKLTFKSARQVARLCLVSKGETKLSV